MKILYSPGYGAGWWTRNDSVWCYGGPEKRDIAMMYFLAFPPLVKAVEENTEEEFPENHPAILEMIECIKKECGDVKSLYLGGAGNLEVYEVDCDRFRIEEHDGYESIIEENDDSFINVENLLSLMDRYV